MNDEAGIWVDGESHPKKRHEVSVQEAIEFQQRAPGTQTLRERIKSNLSLTTMIYRYVLYRICASMHSMCPIPIFSLPRADFTHADWDTLDKRPAFPSGEGFGPLGVSGGLDRVENKLREIVLLGKEHDARVYILIYPWPTQIVYQDRFSWSEHVQKLCKRISCAGVIDTIPVFRDLASKDRNWYPHYYIFNDGHFNMSGNRIIRDELLKSLPR